MNKIELSTKPVVIKSDAIHTIEFKLIYPVINKNEYALINNYLSHLLCESSALLTEESEFEKEKLRKTVLDYYYSTNTICDQMYINITFVLPQEGLVNGYDIEESFKFIVDTIKNPILKNRESGNEKFNHAKNYFRRKHDSAKQDIYGSNNYDIKNIIDPNEIMGNSYETKSKQIDSLSWEDLNKFYQDNILNNDYLVYVYGNVEEDRVNYLFDKYLPQKEKTVTIIPNYINPLPIAEKKLTTIQTKFNQSQLVMEYQVKDMTDEDKLFLSIIINILNAQENNLVFDMLRVKNGLVYDAYVSSAISYGMFTIEAFIEYSNKDKVISLIREVMDSLKDKEKLSKCFEKLVEAYKVDLLKEEDGLYTDLNNRINNDLDIKTTAWQYNEMLNTKVDDILSFLDRIVETNIIIFLEEKAEVQHD